MEKKKKKWDRAGGRYLQCVGGIEASREGGQRQGIWTIRIPET